MPINFRAGLKKIIDSMLETGKIRNSNLEWASPIVLVRKKTGELRIDYQFSSPKRSDDKGCIPNPKN